MPDGALALAFQLLHETQVADTGALSTDEQGSKASGTGRHG